MGSQPAVRVEGLRKRFGDVQAVDDVSFTVESGTCLGLLGPNGAGKTTTVEILEGLTVADEGVAEVLGMRWGEGRDPEIRRRIGVALQETQLADKLTVLEVTKLFRSFYPSGRGALETLDRVALVPKRNARVHQLSGGQRQRLAVACALVGDPDLLFLDEPTTGLDPSARRALWDVIEEFRAGGGSVLLTTHYMEEAERLCDSITIVDGGRVIASGTPSELVLGLGAEQVMELETDGALAVERLRGLEGVGDVSSAGDTLRLGLTDLDRALGGVLEVIRAQGCSVTRLETHPATLEDVFLAHTGRELRDG